MQRAFIRSIRTTGKQMKNIYLISMGACLDVDGTIAFAHNAYLDIAGSKTEFFEMATKHQMREYPPSEGWYNHSSGNVASVSEPLLLEMFADRLGMTVSELEKSMDLIDQFLRS